MSSNFLSMLFRMKYINRWSLMRNTCTENLSQHSFEVAVIAHSLALMHNRLKPEQPVDANETAVHALFHDASEILTGDMPTPIKYHNTKIQKAYKEVETGAKDQLLSMLPDFLREEYAPFIKEDASGYTKKLIKAADKIAALIKCIEEERMGNNEFIQAKQTQLLSLQNMDMPETALFLELFIEGFEKTLDEQSPLESNGESSG